MSSENNHFDSHDAGPEWATPEWVWHPLSVSLGGFDLDPASGAEIEPIADTRFTIEDNGLEQEWFGDVWLNPPYGRSHNPEWASKVSEAKDNADSITALVPASTDTQWFQQHYSHADYLTFVEGRISFNGDKDGKATFANVICSFGNFDADYISQLQRIGFVTETI